MQTHDTVNNLRTAYETSVFKDLFFRLFFASQVSKCINDNTKYQIEDDDDQHEEEYHVIQNSCHKIRVLQNKKDELSNEAFSNEPDLKCTSTKYYSSKAAWFF